MSNKLIQYSTSWCGPCQVARKRISKMLNPDQYLYVEIDTGLIEYEADTDEDIAKHVDSILTKIGRPKSVPSFVLVDEDFGFISKPNDINKTLKSLIEHEDAIIED